MGQIDVTKDLEARTMTVTSDWEAPIDAVWQLWSDPRRLEGWWGPPTYPATVVDFDLTPGGRVTYFMTGPEGERHGGWWRITSVDAPNGFTFEDGFADPDGNPNDAMPVATIAVTLTPVAGGTRMTTVTTWPTDQDMAQVIEMGMEEGTREAMSQIPSVLEELATA